MSERRRILFLAPFPPDPDGSHGGARAIGQMIDQLAGRHDAAVLHMRAPGEVPMPGYLKERLALADEVARPDRQSTHARRAVALGRALARAPGGTPAWVSDWRVPAFARRLAEITDDWRPDVVQAEFHVMGQYLPAAGPARVLVEHEAGARGRRRARRLGARSQGFGPERGRGRLAALRAPRDRGSRCHGRAHGSGSCAACGAGADARIVRIPLGVRTPERALDPVGTDPPRIVFVGNFMHPPNVQAALDLAGSIFPIVSARHPEATLELIGDRPPRALLQLAGPRILVHGSVPDPTPHLDRAALVVVPARLGGGMRVKVLDTLAAGKALVATGRALAGIDLEPGTHALVAESDCELADRIGELLDDPERRGRVAAAGRAFVAERLSWDAAGRSYTELYESLLAERP